MSGSSPALALFGIFQVVSLGRGCGWTVLSLCERLPAFPCTEAVTAPFCTTAALRPSVHDQNALRASPCSVLLIEYPGRYDASRVCIRMDGAVEPFSGSIALYSVYDIFACGYLAVYSSIRRTRRVYIVSEATDARAGANGLSRAVTHGRTVYSRTR